MNRLELLVPNFAYVTLQVLTWNECLQWAVSVLGGVSLIWYNVEKIRRIRRNKQADS